MIQDDDFAIEILKTTNYYRLSAYGLTFQETEGTFSDSSSFIDILSLYQFDQKLRRLLLTLLEDVEITLRTSMAYVIGHRCGPLGGYADGKKISKTPTTIKKNDGVHFCGDRTKQRDLYKASQGQIWWTCPPRMGCCGGHVLWGFIEDAQKSAEADC